MTKKQKRILREIADQLDNMGWDLNRQEPYDIALRLLRMVEKDK